MASAKIATLVIRTLAKPIATQLKSQAAEHPTFRRVCVGLAQTMHRVEMRMRSNLLGANVEHQKIRPLSESKAIANGANAISEGFLFAVAAALIVGESYRSSRSSAKQRNRTEEAVEEVRETLNELTRALGVSVEELEMRIKARREAQEEEEEAISGTAVEGDSSTKLAAGGSSSSSSSSSSALNGTDDGVEASTNSRTSPITTNLATPYSLQDRSAAAAAERHERERLQRAVQVLLSLALRSGWIQGEEALDLDAIMAGKDKAAASRDRAESLSTSASASERAGGGGASGGYANRGTVALAQDQGLRERIASLGQPGVMVFGPDSAVVVNPTSPSTSMPDSPPESLS